jgi:predicted lipid-binding transport protein (Tim44 family)
MRQTAGVAAFTLKSHSRSNMKKLLMAMMVAVIAVTVGVSTAEAKRLGGGGSFGKQSQGMSRQGPAQSTQAASPSKPAAAAATPSPWKGILGGALLGLGLGALLSHFGLGGALASMIGTILMVALLGLAALFIYRMLRRKSADNGPRVAYAGRPSSMVTPQIGSHIEPVRPAALQSAPLASGIQAAGDAPYGIPADFDTPNFLRHGKTYFIRLQAAWDKADINDIREFTTPEMFAELKMQLQERGASPNHTDVMSLDAELLGVETVGEDCLASIKFSGMIKESESEPAAAFAEIWNLSKPMAGQGGWLLAGVQQLS